MTVTHQKPVIILRMSDLRDNHMTLGLFCLECDRWGEIKPQSWLDEGKPDLNYVEQRFKCGQCGGRATKQVRSNYTGLGTGTAYVGR